MSKQSRVNRPAYVADFHCIGGDCEDSCCIGWDIDIDKITFRQYFRTKNEAMKKAFSKFLYRNEYCESEDVDYGRVRIDKRKWCAFLNQDKLCDIYINLGEDYLSNVCTSYPRVYNKVDGVYELSLYMSCPEAVRQLMKDPKPIRFSEDDLVLDKHIVNAEINTNEKRWIQSPVKHLKKLRSQSIKLVQDRDIPMEKRLLNLGKKFYQRGGSHVKSDHPGIFRLGFFRTVIDSLNVFDEIDNPPFVEFTRTLMKSLQLDGNLGLSQIEGNYLKAEKDIVDPFLAENAYLFEHYFVNFMFKGNFPMTENLDPFDGYLMLIFRYSFMKFYLTGLAASQGMITKEDVMLMIQCHTKATEHHKSFMHDLLIDIHEREFNNMDFASLLIGVKG